MAHALAARRTQAVVVRCTTIEMAATGADSLYPVSNHRCHPVRLSCSPVAERCGVALENSASPRVAWPCAMQSAGVSADWNCQHESSSPRPRLGLLRERFAMVVVFLACMVGCSRERPSGGLAAISAGRTHTCAVSSIGQAVCWGNNQSGQIGAASFIERNSKTVLVPSLVENLLDDVLSISTGWQHSCAIRAGDGAYCWGYNLRGVLGDGTTASRRGVTRVIGLPPGIVAVSAGEYHTCVLTESGGVVCWGRNSSGAVGDGTTDDRILPTPVIGLSSGIVAISAGNGFNSAVKSSGEVLCWGSNQWGCLGDGTMPIRPVPGPVVGLRSPMLAVSSGSTNVCALDSDNGVVCWGGHRERSAGVGTDTDRHAPRGVGGLESGVAQVSVGSAHACAVTRQGAALCWGHNKYGQLGDGTTTDRDVPTQVGGLEPNVVSISAGAHHTCAIRASGAALCWGSNGIGRFGDGHGRLGDGSTTDRLVPTPVVGYP